MLFFRDERRFTLSQRNVVQILAKVARGEA